MNNEVLQHFKLVAPGHPEGSVEAVAHLKAGACKGTQCPEKKKLEAAQSVVGMAHANYAEDEFLKSNSPKAFQHSELAMEMDALWNQWPFFCSKYRTAFGDGIIKGKPAVSKEKAWAVRWIEEIEAVGRLTGPGGEALKGVVADLRHYECSDAFIKMELGNFYRPLDFKTTPGAKPAAYTPQNYQYGTFFFNGFQDMMDSDKIKPFVDKVKAEKGEYLMLGGNVGNEACLNTALNPHPNPTGSRLTNAL